jgi:hypothetical protein
VSKQLRSTRVNFNSLGRSKIKAGRIGNFVSDRHQSRRESEGRIHVSCKSCYDRCDLGYLYWGMAWGDVDIMALMVFVGPGDDSCLSYIAQHPRTYRPDDKRDPLPCLSLGLVFLLATYGTGFRGVKWPCDGKSQRH